MIGRLLRWCSRFKHTESEGLATYVVYTEAGISGVEFEKGLEGIDVNLRITCFEVIF